MIEMKQNMNMTPPAVETEQEEEQIRTLIKESLEKTDKGGTANTIMNCVAVYERDPIFAGKISRNLLTETDDITGPMP